MRSLIDLLAAGIILMLGGLIFMAFLALLAAIGVSGFLLSIL